MEVFGYFFFFQAEDGIRDIGVTGVQTCALPICYGEELCAWVKLRGGEAATEAEIVDFCRGQIAHYKIPRYVRFVESFPMTVTGKIQKFEIRAAMIAELGLVAQRTA